MQWHLDVARVVVLKCKQGGKSMGCLETIQASEIASKAAGETETVVISLSCSSKAMRCNRIGNEGVPNQGFIKTR